MAGTQPEIGQGEERIHHQVAQKQHAEERDPSHVDQVQIGMEVAPRSAPAAHIEGAVLLDDPPEVAGVLLCQAGVKSGFLHTYEILSLSGIRLCLVPGDWPVPRSDSARGNTTVKPQAASVAIVSAASGSFEDFTSGGVAADAKSSKLTTGASMPRAKICWRSRLRRSSKDGRADWRRHFGSGR